MYIKQGLQAVPWHKVRMCIIKLCYAISFRIAVYFWQILMAKLKEAPCFVISFNDSLNHELQQEQVDLMVRYFKQGKAASRYLTSAFLGHSVAEGL